MSLLNSNTTVDTITWNSTLRPKVGLSVLYNGATWINTTGSNSEPGVGSDWVSGGGGKTSLEFNSIEDLRNSEEPSDNELAYVKGYYEPNDGGGGEFIWDETSEETSNGGTIIQVTGVVIGRWKRVVLNYVDVRWFGAKYNDVLYEEINTTALYEVIKSNNKLVISGKLYINPINETLSNDSIHITGTGADSELVVSTTSTLFTTSGTKSIIFDNITITALNSSLRLFDKPSGSVIYENISIKNSVFNGNISLRLYGTNDGNTVIKKIKVCNNWFNNSDSSFFVLLDINYDTVEFLSNNVRNFKYVFLNLGLTTPISRNGYAAHCLISNNTIINDSECYLDVVSGAYYAFALIESNFCKYSENYVEGIKSVVPIAVYDIYMNSFESVYENNIYKNNMNFSNSGDAGIKTLFKGKGSRIITCKNNSFTIDKSFLENFISNYTDTSLNIEDCYVSISSLNVGEGNEKFLFENNYISVYKILGGHPILDGNELIFSSNNIAANKASGSLVSVLSTDNKRSFKANSNSIMITDDAINNSTFIFYRDDALIDNPNITFDISYNNIDGNVNALSEYLRGEYLKSIGNTLSYVGSGSFPIHRIMDIEKCYIKNNSINQNGAGALSYLSYSTISNLSSVIDLTINNGIGSMFAMGLPVRKKDYSYTSYREIEFNTGSLGIVKFNHSVFFKQDGTSQYLIYKNIDTGQDVTLDITSNPVSNIILYTPRSPIDNSVLFNYRMYIDSAGEARLVITSIKATINNLKIKIKEDVY